MNPIIEADAKALVEGAKNVLLKTGLASLPNQPLTFTHISGTGTPD